MPRVLTRNRSARGSALRRSSKHEFGGLQARDVFAQIACIVSPDGFGEDAMRFVHRDVADDRKTAVRIFRQGFQPCGARARPHHHDAPFEPVAIDRMAQNQTREPDQHRRQAQRVEQGRTPEAHRGHHEIHNRQRDAAERQRHECAGKCVSRTAQRLGAVEPDGHQREPAYDGKAEDRRQTVEPEPGIDADLNRPHMPSKVACKQQQGQVAQPEQQHRVRNVVLEQADHALRRAPSPRGFAGFLVGPGLSGSGEMSVNFTGAHGPSRQS